MVQTPYEAIRGFKNAWLNLLNTWDEDPATLDRLLNTMYPFQTCFSDLYHKEITMWMDDALDRLERTIVSEPIFFWRDLSGRGETAQIGISSFVDFPDDGVPEEWLEEAEIGDEWTSPTESYIRIS